MLSTLTGRYRLLLLGLCSVYRQTCATEIGNTSRIELLRAPTKGSVKPVLNKAEAALLLLVGFGGFALTLAIVHRVIRTRIFRDVNKLDTAFDAGGNVTWSLTAVTVASQFFWPGDILQSATLTAKIGVAGPFWYSVGIIVNILLFPVFSVSLKTRAPGAKTYLQVFYLFGDFVMLVFEGSGLCRHPSQSSVKPVLNKAEAALLLLVGFGGFALTLAIVHRVIRTRIFRDVNKLDTAFDAGGNVTWSLTAVTVASQFFWPGDILQSATLTAKIGVAGPFWYSVGIIVNILLFPVFSVSLKTRAPGAKTYLQIFRARFGRKTHVVFCFFALSTTCMITVSTLLAGKVMIQSLVDGASDEFVLVSMAFLFGSYSLVGGLGTTFYVSYFNACLVFVILITFVAKVIYFPPDSAHLTGRHTSIGNLSAIYDAIRQLLGPEGNTDRSYLTFQSTLAILYGTLSILLGTSSTFCDQALWQSRIAAKPLQGVWGFLLAGLIWFTVPMTMASTTGLTYLVLSYENGSHLLTPEEINAGLVTPLVAERMLGQTGGIMILAMGAMALMSTGSGEIMGLSSIIVYDIYQVYLKPFREYTDCAMCIICGRKQNIYSLASPDTSIAKVVNHANDISCRCTSVEFCEDCAMDVKGLQASIKAYNQAYNCHTHGPFRSYQDKLVRVKSWCILIVTLVLVPFGMLIFESGIDLNWMFYTGSIIIIPCFIPVILSIAWVKATSKGLVTGSLGGLVAGVTSALVSASTLEGGLSKFVRNTADEFTLMVGCYTSFFVSLILSVVVSLFTHSIQTQADVDAEWEKTRQIDNPLNPWHVYYKSELEGLSYSGRPTLLQLAEVFKPARYSALIGGSVLVILAMFVMPGILSIFPVLTFTEFSGYVKFSHVLAVIMAVIVVFVAPSEEIYTILKQKRSNKFKEDIPDEMFHLNEKEI